MTNKTELFVIQIPKSVRMLVKENRRNSASSKAAIMRISRYKIV